MKINKNLEIWAKFGSGALPGTMLLVRIVENNKINGLF